jgi:preprotein translocase subunit SecF
MKQRLKWAWPIVAAYPLTMAIVIPLSYTIRSGWIFPLALLIGIVLGTLSIIVAMELKHKIAPRRLEDELNG